MDLWITLGDTKYNLLYWVEPSLLLILGLYLISLALSYYIGYLNAQLKYKYGR